MEVHEENLPYPSLQRGVNPSSIFVSAFENGGSRGIFGTPKSKI
jgi:hypothetical protein